MLFHLPASFWIALIVWGVHAVTSSPNSLMDLVTLPLFTVLLIVLIIVSRGEGRSGNGYVHSRNRKAPEEAGEAG